MTWEAATMTRCGGNDWGGAEHHGSSFQNHGNHGSTVVPVDSRPRIEVRGRPTSPFAGMTWFRLRCDMR